MSNRFHNKFHRENHHSIKNAKNQDHLDASYDPIASFDSPFQGEFYSEGDITTTENISAQKYVYAQDGLIHNQFTVKSDLSAASNVIIDNNLSVNSVNVKEQILSAGNDLFDIFLTTETDSQSLTFNESTYELSISNSNSVNLGSINSAISQVSADWDSVYSNINLVSADIVLTDTSGTVPGLSAVTKIIAVSALPVTQEVGTLYIVI